MQRTQPVNFIEAVNSGEKVNPIGYSQFFYTIEDLMNGDYTVEELVNAKYLVEEKKITITESQFDEANEVIEYYGRDKSNWIAVEYLTKYKVKG